MLGIEGHGTRGTKAVKLHPVGHGQCIHCSPQGFIVEPIAYRQQCADGGVKNAVRELRHRVAIVHRELGELTTAGQHLGELKLEVLETVAAKGAAEAHHGRLAHLCLGGKIHDPHMDHFIGVTQHEPRYLLFGATEMLHAASHFIEQGAAHVQLLKFLIVLMQPRWPQYA